MSTHIIPRPRYLNKLKTIIQNGSKKIILLHGGRGSGKTTILKQLISEPSLSQKKYYFSFDEDVVAKKFKNAQDFKGYMQIKYGIDFEEHNLLLLNEIQYSKNIISIFNELTHETDNNTIIIATGIIQTNQDNYKLLASSGYSTTITVHPLGFFNFLDHKNIHTKYLSLENPSSVMFKEIQGLFDEYLTWGGYPEIIRATSQERKQQHLKAIIQKIYDKDIGFYFNRDEILVFQELMEQLCHETMTGFKFKTLSLKVEMSISLLKRYMEFFEDNCLIYPIPYFFTDKTRELSHQEIISIGDMGIINYMTQHFGSKLNNQIMIKNFVANEIIKYMSDTDKCMSYKKINNSSIDFIILHEDETITPIIVSSNNTPSAPKVYKGFHQQYGHRVRRYIKTTPLLVSKSQYNDKEFVCVPHFMIQTLVGS